MVSRRCRMIRPACGNCIRTHGGMTESPPATEIHDKASAIGQPRPVGHQMRQIVAQDVVANQMRRSIAKRLQSVQCRVQRATFVNHARSPRAAAKANRRADFGSTSRSMETHPDRKRAGSKVKRQGSEFQRPRAASKPLITLSPGFESGRFPSGAAGPELGHCNRGGTGC